ncbi:hypothetical protein H5410_037662 [Solanum commersonii]|uniref:Uncharacterized protein n=1 Tax=Solanum commersonii TaxID=4109 RepID=A0A9J5YBT0_SOLCO|nr:hypothetical protein H5410_037662 [Solanum commersonii]
MEGIMIVEVVNNARSCYVDGSTDKYNNHEFALMMLIELSTTDRYNKIRTTRHHLGKGWHYPSSAAATKKG